MVKWPNVLLEHQASKPPYKISPLPAPVGNSLNAAAANPVQIFLKLLRATQGFDSVVVAGQLFIIEQEMDATVTRLAKVSCGTMPPAFFARHQMVARQLLYFPLAEGATSASWLGAFRR